MLALVAAPGCAWLRPRPTTSSCDPRWSVEADQELVAVMGVEDEPNYPALADRIDKLQSECCGRSREDLPEWCGVVR